MKRISKIIVALLFFLMIPLNVKAVDKNAYRADETKGRNITVDGTKVHVSIGLDFNISSTGEAGDTRFVDNFDAKYENGTIHVTLKRSEINKLFKNANYDNAWSRLEIYADYLIKDDRSYYYFRQSDYREPYLYCSLARQDYTYKNYKYIDMNSTAIDLAGLKSEFQTSSGGEFVLFVADEEPNYELYPRKYTKDEIDYTKDTKLVHFKKTDYKVTLIEDVEMDLGNIEHIVSDPTVDPDTNEVKYDKVEKVENYYAEYLSNNKIKYSWTMFDKDGNPVELKNDTMIKIDDKETEEKIYKNIKDELEWWKDLSDHIKVLSFAHDGDLNGTARISLYVGDKFKAGEILTLYYFNPDKFQLENVVAGLDKNLTDEEKEEQVYKIWEESLDTYEILVDKDGYISIELTHCSDYLLVDNVAKEKIVADAEEQYNNKEEKDQTKDTKKENDSKEKKSILPIVIISSVALIGIVVGVVIYLKKKKSKKVVNNTPVEEEPKAE